MTKILLVNACVRPNSRTYELANYVLGKILSKEDGIVEEVKLYDEDLWPLTLTELVIRDKASKDNDYSGDLFKLAKQFANAEIIVVAAPYWDLSFPAVVKSYFEKVTVNGLTFRYGSNGIPQGLCLGKKLYYVTTSGGPIINNFGYDYVTALAKNFYGISETFCVKAEGLDIYGADVNKIMDDAKKAFDY